MNFTVPIISFPFVVLANENEPYVGSISKINNKKFAITKGYAAIELLKRRYTDIELIEVDSIEDGVDLTKKREVYGYIDTAVSMDYYYS